MPTYEFLCPDGHLTEEVFLFSEMPDVVDCLAETFDQYGMGEVSEPYPCQKEAKRQLSSSYSIINNHVMLAPSKRMRGRGGS